MWGFGGGRLLVRAVLLLRLPSCACCCSCGGRLLLRRAEAGSRPAASHFLLLRQKKLTKEKATRVPEALRAPLRYSVLRGLPKLASLRQRQPLSAKPPFLALAHTGGSGTGSTTASQGVGPLLRSASNEGAGSGSWSTELSGREANPGGARSTHQQPRRRSALTSRPSEAKARHPAKQWLTPFLDCPVCARARNGGKTDQGWRCLSEASLARPRFHEYRSGARRASRTRVAFSFVSFFWRSKRK